MPKKKKKIEEDKLVIGVNNYVEHSMAILDRIHELLDKKFDGRQKELANHLGKSEAEISKWLNGVQNFTLFTISKLEEAFNEPIIGVCTDDINATFVQVVPSECIKEKVLEVEYSGKMVELEKLNTEVEFNIFTEKKRLPDLV